MEGFVKDRMERELEAVYAKWWTEVKAKGFDDEKYSNPFFCGIPENWCESKTRIMIVGEEGYGSWMKGEIEPSDIKQLQKHNVEYVNGTRERGNFSTNKGSAFWKRVKQIEYLQLDWKVGQSVTQAPTAVIWSDCDKICAGDCHFNGKTGRLSNRERKLLHSVDTKLLKREIEVLKPSHVVFLGWYTESLKQNDLFFYKKKLGPGNGYNYPLDIETIEIGGRKLKIYYLYHPGLRKNLREYNIDLKIVIDDIKSDAAPLLTLRESDLS